MAEFRQEQRTPYDYSNTSKRDNAYYDIFGAVPPGRSQTYLPPSSTLPLQMAGPEESIQSPSSEPSSRLHHRGLPPARPLPDRGYHDALPQQSSREHIDGPRSRGYFDGAPVREFENRSTPQPQRYPARGQWASPESPIYIPHQQRSSSAGNQLSSQYSQFPSRLPNLPHPQGPPPSGLQQHVQPNPSPYSQLRSYPRGPPPPQQLRQPTLLARRTGDSAPAIYNDSSLSQSQTSLASAPRSLQYNSHNPSFRYPPPNPSQTTAQGRHIPGRVPENGSYDRAMSMTGYPSHNSSNQTMSGRIIPNRLADPASAQMHLSNGNSTSIDPSLTAFPTTAAYYAHGSASRTRSLSSSSCGNDPSRSMSLASTITPSVSDTNTLAYRPSTRSVDSERPPTAKIRAPLVYPALLSRVAACFRRKIITGDRTKHELTYHHAFSGAEAVDVLSYIIRTTDRNLALLLGRALDAQKFFHDVTYEHRLRDSTPEMYQFRETMMEEEEENPLVNGVFVLLTECYSPTCTRDQLCYSIACPNRLEQMSRLNLKVRPGLRKTDDANINEDDADQTDEQKLWINTVPREIADSVGERERKRQEVISEICYTERDFVKDLEYLRDFWIQPLRSKASPIPASRRDKIVKTVFSNIIDPQSIHNVSSRFAKSLTDRQQQNPVVHNVGDIFLEFVPQFEPFIYYCSKQLEAKFGFENERSSNPYFTKFVDDIERRKESRKLELNGYLTKPTTRLARYPLLLQNVLKYTDDDNPDKTDVPRVLTAIRDLLGRVNNESGKAENRFNLRRLHEQLRFRPHDRMDLKLTEDGRELVYKSLLKKSPTDPSEITAYLFDHAVLLVKVRQVAKTEEIKAYRRPIPLELLSIREMEDVIPEGGIKRSSSSILPSIRANVGDTRKSEGWPLTFRHLGKMGYELTLYAANQPARKKWLEFIYNAQERLRARADFFNTSVISSNFFVSTNRVNCVVPFDGGRKLLYGTDNGLYVSDRKATSQQPRHVIETANVTQVDILEEYQLLLVLSNKSLLSYPLLALDPNEPALSRRPRKIQNHCSYFKTGICLSRHLVCCFKPNAMSTTIKVFEPSDAMTLSKKQKGLGRLLNAHDDMMKPFKEISFPTESSSVHFLKSKLCVGCSRGFEVVSLETLETQSLLDQADTSLDFVSRKENVKPIHIERLNGEFLLNYSEFSFFVNRNGWRARNEWRIDWEGTPQSFALSYPWILAFEPNFIELRNIENGAVHIVPHKNTRMLHSSTHEILFAYEDEKGDDVVEAVDFWTKAHQKTAVAALSAPTPGQPASP